MKNEELKKTIKKEEENKQVENDIFASEETFEHNIEEDRKNIFSLMAKARKRSSIGYAIVMVLAFAALIGLFLNIFVLALIAGIVAIACVIAIYILNKKIGAPNTSNFYYDCLNKSNSYLLPSPSFSDIDFNKDKKLDMGEVFLDKVYSGVVAVQSRDWLTAKYENHPFSYCDCNIRKGIYNRQDPTLFIGKRISIGNTLNFEGRFMILAKGEKDMDLPNNYDDITLLYEENNYAFYGTEGLDVKEILGNDFFNAIKRIEVKKHLYTMMVSVIAGTTTVYLSFDPDTIELPSDKPFSVEPLTQARKVLSDVFKAVVLLEK